MDNFYSVLIGVVSSLLATTVFISATELFRRVFLPWYADKVYRGVRIDGNWQLVSVKGHSIDEDAPTSKLGISQKGDVITGSYQHPHLNTGSICEYDFLGKIRDMYLLGSADPKSKTMIDAISFLLFIEYEDGTLKLKGSLLCRGKPGEIEHFSDAVYEKRPS